MTFEQRLHQFLRQNYGMGINDLQLMTPALGPIMSFVCRELEEMDLRLNALENPPPPPQLVEVPKEAEPEPIENTYPNNIWGVW